MPTITDDAVCIRRWDFSETSQTVSLFTRGHGIIRGLAKGSKRQKGSFSGGLDLLTRGQLVAIVKPGRELATLTAWHLEDIYPAVRKDLAANRAGLYIADLVHHMLLEHDPHPIVFDQLIESLARLGAANAIELALLDFQWVLLVEAGYRPMLDRQAPTGGGPATFRFDPAAGGLIEDAQAAGGRGGGGASSGGPGAWRVRRETIDVLRQIETGSLASRPAAPLDPESLRRANRLLAAYFRHIIGSQPHAMTWAFADL